MTKDELRAYRQICRLHENLIVGMQSAWIEWQRGQGAEAAMGWIHNMLDDPGLVPDDTGLSAQEYDDRHSIKHDADLH